MTNPFFMLAATGVYFGQGEPKMGHRILGDFPAPKPKEATGEGLKPDHTVHIKDLEEEFGGSLDDYCIGLFRQE